MKIYSLARWSFLAITGFWVAVIASSSSFSAREQSPAENKIAPWVLEKTASGGEAEFLIVLADQADVSGAQALTTKEEKGRFVRDTLWNHAQATQKPLLAWLADRKIEHRSFYIVNMIWAKGSRDTALAIANRPDVLRLDGNPQIKNVPEPLPAEEMTESAPVPNTPATVETGVNYTRAPLVWAAGFTGQGIVVGGADTGYRWTHNALKGHYRGWDGTNANHDYNWHDSIHSPATGGTCGPDSPMPCDDNGHGTHTIGTAIGDDGAGNQIGMAPGAKWIGCRNMDQGNGTPARYIECMEFFLAPYPVTGTPAQGDATKAPNVTTNSWGCPASEGCSATSLQQAVEAQRAAGITMVVAAGNSGSACSTVSDPPSFYEANYTVGALNTGADTIASFSSRGPVTADSSLRRKPDISAPGTSTRSSYRTSDTSYASLSGTSMATPHVAGAVALLLSARPGLINNVTGIRDTLNQAAVHINSNGCDAGSPSTWPNNTFGYGRLDVKAAVDSLALVSAASRKVHGAAGTFDIPLPLVGEPGVECRSSSGNHTLVFTFNTPVMSGSASVTSGTASMGAATFSGNTMSVDLTGVADVQKVTLMLTGVTSTTAQTLPDTAVSVNMLIGDVNRNKTVSASDIAQVKSLAGAPVDATNFTADVAVSGTINASDIGLVKSRSGFSVP